MILLYFVIGAILGSFAAALTYRWPKNESISQGRSKCPNCEHLIRSYDNIPIFSYLILGGKCRDCKKTISSRYIWIETTMAVLFSVFYYFGIASPLNLFLVFITLCIFVVDFEYQYIPDSFTFLALLIVSLSLLFSTQSPYIDLAAGIFAGLFLLSIHLGTFGRGMGLGDVKLALFMGAYLGYPMTITWMFAAFVIGSVIGLLLIAFRFKKFRQKIAFGPFLVASFYLTLLFGSKLTDMIFPYIWQ